MSVYLNFMTVEIRNTRCKQFVSIILNNGQTNFIESSLNIIRFL